MNGVFVKMGQIVESSLGWPLILYVVGVSIICTMAFKFVQIRYFIRAWKEIIMPSDAVKPGDMTPFQAFVNTLSTNLGNGSLAGVATAIHAGGPGAALWILLFGLILMSVRFAEVYLSIYFGARAKEKSVLGGPMLYLREITGGTILAYIYALCAFIFGVTSGSAIQTNSIAVSLKNTWGVPDIVTACIMLLFTIYVIYGGAHRVVALSERIVPIKVIVFFVSSFIILGYHYQALMDAFWLICTSAFQPVALTGGIIGFSVQQAMRFGMTRSVAASESGLGTAAILFSATGSTEPVKDSLMGMISTFVSTLVCFIIATCIVASGVWDSGLNGTALTIASFNTVFGQYGGWLVSFLSIAFGIGVLVSYVYITRVVWLSLTGGRYEQIFTACYLAAAFAGAIVSVDRVWYISEVTCGGMLFINLLGIVCLTPVIRDGLSAFSRKN